MKIKIQIIEENKKIIYQILETIIRRRFQDPITYINKSEKVI